LCSRTWDVQHLSKILVEIVLQHWGTRRCEELVWLLNQFRGAHEWQLVSPRHRLDERRDVGDAHIAKGEGAVATISENESPLSGDHLEEVDAMPQDQSVR